MEVARCSVAPAVEVGPLAVNEGGPVAGSVGTTDLDCDDAGSDRDVKK
jgi:hypothetical protein